MLRRNERNIRRQHVRGPGMTGLVALCALACVGCGPKLQNGAWSLTADGAPVIDTCGLAPAAANGALWSGQLTTSGTEVFFTLSIPVQGRPVPEAPRLQGFFKAAQTGRADGFLADATALDAPAPVPGIGGGCASERLVMHMDASIDDADHFIGELTVSYDLARPAATDPCAQLGSPCQLVTRFKAALVAPQN
ncbi:MAG: hypothetical protein JST54_28800 [Deltaproteobacteria bacterium]|nr:hypothetical protein [Deltaproteobacteria bacterium]